MGGGRDPVLKKEERGCDSMTFDHVVVLVPDLEAAAASYRDAGFTVTPGGVHEGGATRNALIVFADGSYLELLAFTRRYLLGATRVLGRLGLTNLTRRANPVEDRFVQRAVGGPGLIDFALRPDSLPEEMARLRREGIRVDGPIAGGRRAEDGGPISWETALPGPSDLPFLCADVTERSRRVPGGPATDHSNGVTGVAALTVAVERVEMSSARYRALLGKEPDPQAREHLSNARGRIFRVGSTDLVVASTDEPRHPIRRHLRQRGEGPYSLKLWTTGPPRSAFHGPTQGIRLELATSPE